MVQRWQREAGRSWVFKDDLCSEQSGLSAVVRPSKWQLGTVISLEGGLTSLQQVSLPEASVCSLSIMKSFTHTLTTSKSSKQPLPFSFLTSKCIFEINPDADSTNLVQLLKKYTSSTEGRRGSHIVDQKLQEWPFLGWCWLRISVTTLGKRPPWKARWLLWPRGLMSPCLYFVSHRKAVPGIRTVAEMFLSRGDHCPEY